MIKINISFSKKIPVPGQQFSSLSFHGSMERELSDGLTGPQIQGEFQKGYSLLEQTVEQEIIRYTGNEQAVQIKPAKPPAMKVDDHATNKQLNFINRRGAESGLTQQQVNVHLINCIGKDSIEMLTKKEASTFIDYLGEIQQRAA